jgi:hypothetical protein
VRKSDIFEIDEEAHREWELLKLEISNFPADEVERVVIAVGNRRRGTTDDSSPLGSIDTLVSFCAEVRDGLIAGRPLATEDHGSKSPPPGIAYAPNFSAALRRGPFADQTKG